MNRRSVVLAALSLLLLAARAPEVQVQARHGKSLRGTFDGLPLVFLKGSHAERGRDHGYLCAREIVQLIDAIVPVAKARKSADWDRDIVPATRRFTWPARFETELAAMLEGIREALPDKAARMLKNAGREVSIDDLKVANCLSDLFGMGCSSFSAWGDLTPDGQVITGRNADYTTFPIPFTYAIVAVQPAEKELRPTLSASYMGMAASGTVMSSEGVFAAVHDESGLPREGKTFVPRMLTVQAAVESARTDHAVEDIAQALRKAPTAAGTNLHVSAPLSTTSLPSVLEWDGNSKDQGVTVRSPKPDEFRTGLACTNHFRARAERNANCGRYAKLSDGLHKAGEGGKIDLAAAQRMLDSVAPNGGSMTYLAVVVFPKDRRMVVAFSTKAGVSATKGRWVTVDWDAVFKG